MQFCQARKGQRAQWPIIVVALVWLLLFGPRLLTGITPKAGAWVAISAFLFWPMIFRWWSRWLTVLVLMPIGMVDIFHSHNFNALADEFFLATAMRTNPAEMVDYLRTLAIRPTVESIAWLAYCTGAGVILGRCVPLVLHSHRILRWSWLAPASVWLALGMLYASGDVLRRFELMDKTRNVYPLHLAWAALAQRSIADALLYLPYLPRVAPDAAPIATVVAVIGESASAQRWSALGYRTHLTNGPLDGIAGLGVVQAWAQGFTTAQALPFMLTGFSVAQSVERRAPSFLDLAKRAGYKVFVLDNSRTSAAGDFFGRVLRRSTDLYHKTGNGGETDGVLTAPLQAALQDPAALKLIVLHTSGSHEIVQDRYPRNYARFADPYDNSVLYTSALLARWIDMLSQYSATPSALFYTSDHGLAMPPCVTSYMHGRSLSALEVPFLAWGNRVAHMRMPELFALDANAAHTNAMMMESVVRAIGYGALLTQPGWPSSNDPMFEGRGWRELRELNACSLR